MPANEKGDEQLRLEGDDVMASYQRQLGELHGQIAVKDAMIAKLSRDITEVRATLEALATVKDSINSLLVEGRDDAQTNDDKDPSANGSARQHDPVEELQN